jgi:hypothetical protein
VPVPGEVADALEQQRRKFVERRGREPGPDDPLLFDLPPLEHVEHQMVQAMHEAGLDPAFIYAFERTGLLVTEQNQHLIPEKDLDDRCIWAWDEACVRSPKQSGNFEQRAEGNQWRNAGRPGEPVIIGERDLLGDLGS